MKISLCGATGRAGSRILDELLARHHQVIAIVRQEASLPPRVGVTIVVNDLSNAERTAKIIHGTEALISAYAPPQDDPEELVGVTRRLMEAVALGKVRRFLMVGGAGTLEVSRGLTLLQSGKLPPEWRPIALAHAHALEVMRSATIAWTCLSPALYFDPGERTCQFRLGEDDLIFDDKGESRISMEDYAIAMVGELEDAQHVRQRFSIGY